MDYYVALDVSLKETSVCVLNADGSVAFEGRAPSDPVSLAQVIRTKAPRAVKIGLETGAISVWLWHALKAEGLPVCQARSCRSLDPAHQVRPQRCPRLGRHGAHGLVSGSANQEPGGP